MFTPSARNSLVFVMVVIIGASVLLGLGLLLQTR
jgi:hypothetical protein